MTGAVLELKWDDAALRDAVHRLITFDNERAAKMWDAIGLVTVSQTQMRFDSQSDPSGAAWIPSQRARRTGGQTLYEEGFLYASLTYNVLGSSGLEEGSNRAYAAVHQFGYDRKVAAHKQTLYRHYGKGKTQLYMDAGFVKKSKANLTTEVNVPDYTIHIPPRPYLGISDQDGAEITAVAVKHLEYALLGTRP